MSDNTCKTCIHFLPRHGYKLFDGLCMKKKCPASIKYCATLDDLAERLGYDSYAASNPPSIAMLLSSGWPKVIERDRCDEHESLVIPDGMPADPKFD